MKQWEPSPFTRLVGLKIISQSAERTESELHVRNAVATLCKNRTTVVIAHRLHTIVHADKIVVVEKGAAVEQGRHEELLRRNGRYAAFYRLQIEKAEAGEGEGETTFASTGAPARSADVPIGRPLSGRRRDQHDRRALHRPRHAGVALSTWWRGTRCRRRRQAPRRVRDRGPPRFAQA